MSYQKITGPVMANSHPGSYCGQDAYNDMFVTERYEKLLHGKRTTQSGDGGADRGIELHARPTSRNFDWGGVL